MNAEKKGTNGCVSSTDQGRGNGVLRGLEDGKSDEKIEKKRKERKK